MNEGQNCMQSPSNALLAATRTFFSRICGLRSGSQSSRARSIPWRADRATAGPAQVESARRSSDLVVIAGWINEKCSGAAYFLGRITSDLLPIVLGRQKVGVHG
jgi:hypothetical protein